MKNTRKKDHLKKTQKNYSLAFKLELVNEIEKGHLTYMEAQIKYGIQGKTTALTWLRKHGILDWKSKVPMKNKKPPRTYISELEKKIKRLEAEKEILNRTIDIADETLGTEIRKKYLLLSQEASKGQEGKKEDQ